MPDLDPGATRHSQECDECDSERSDHIYTYALDLPMRGLSCAQDQGNISHRSNASDLERAAVFRVKRAQVEQHGRTGSSGYILFPRPEVPLPKLEDESTRPDKDGFAEAMGTAAGTQGAAGEAI